MANRAYLSLWTKNFSEASILEQFETLLKTVPLSAQRPGFTELVIRPVDATETPVVERDLRSQPLDAVALVAVAREHLHADSAYEVLAHWDLWVYDLSVLRWQVQPQRLEIFCHGEDYDSGIYAEAGHLQASIGFEHLFTGHAGLLGTEQPPTHAPEHPAEAEFLALMKRPDKLRQYQQKTRENIEKLMDWIRAIESNLPVDRVRLWSEGEGNLEARLDEILAVR